MIREAWLRATLILAFSCAPTSGPSVPFGQSQEGIATYYDADGSGACMFDRGGDLRVAAMNAPQFDNSAACGTCVRITGAKGSVTVRIVDLCPECQSGHLDLSREAFAEIDEPLKGRVPITWQTVTCEVTGPVQYKYKDGSSQWWAAIQVRNHKLPIAKLEHFKDGAWRDIPRERYNHFVISDGPGPGEVRVRITSTDNQILEDTLPAAVSELIVSGVAQFR